MIQKPFLCVMLDYKNLQFKQLIDDIAIDFLFSGNFASIEDIRRKYNLVVDFQNSHQIKIY